MKYKHKEKVIINSLGDGKEYRAEIRGIANKEYDTTYYIVMLIDSFLPDDYEYDCAVISEHCLRKDISKYKDGYGCYLDMGVDGEPHNNCVLDNDNGYNREDCCECDDNINIKTRQDCKYWMKIK